VSSSRERERGQVLVLFAVFIVVLLGSAALAVDVSGYNADLGRERSAADAAALAGAQDMFRSGSTTVDAPEWRKARSDAMRTAISHLTRRDKVTVADLPLCGQSAPLYAANIVNCAIAGTRYYISVAAPAPTCLPPMRAACDDRRSVQVTIRDPRHPVSFSRIFGQSSFNAAVTSIGELSPGTNWAFVTLRPPKPSRSNSGPCAPSCDDNQEDISLSGSGTSMSVVRGDVGTNTNLVLNSGTTVTLDVGSYVYRYDAYKAWIGNPVDKQMSVPIPDPNYTYPVRPTDVARIYARTDPATKYQLDGPSCDAEIAKIPAAYLVPAGGGSAAPPTVTCWRPGVYQSKVSSSTPFMVLTPGVYFFDGGLQPGNNVKLIGGYDASTSGVALVFPRSCSPDCTFAGNGTALVALNAGAAYPSGSGALPGPAINWDGRSINTGGRVPLPLTMMVERDSLCVVATTDSPSCRENQNNALNIPGGGSLFVFGVQYAPTDNVAITGGAGSNGYLGRIWAWTVKYSGNSNINLIGASNPEPGVLRIAIPCSPGADCDNPEAFVAIP
jgi:hypothetical protein